MHNLLSVHGVDIPGYLLQRMIFDPLADTHGLVLLVSSICIRLPDAAATQNVMELVEQHIFPCVVQLFSWIGGTNQVFRQNTEFFGTEHRVFTPAVSSLDV